MAVVPGVLVYQEDASVATPDTTATLNSLIAGPAYHIQDYGTDDATIQVADYGTLTGASDPTLVGNAVGVPAPGTDAIIVAEPPNNTIGGILDHNSVIMAMESVQVQVMAGAAGVFSGTAPNENQFTVAGGNFAANLVRPGDRLVITDPAHPSKATVLKIVQEVGQYAGSTLGADFLVVTSNYGVAGTDINGDPYTGAALTGLDFRIEHAVPDSDASGTYISLTGNSTTVKGGLLWSGDLAGTSVVASYIVSYAKMFMEYRSLRQDLALVTEVTATTIASILGRLDERNPLYVGAHLALKNASGFPIQCFGVVGDDLNGATDRLAAYTNMLIVLQPRKDIHAITPLTLDVGVIDATYAHCNAFSVPEKSRFRMEVAGWGPLMLLATIGSTSIAGTSESAGDDPGVFIIAGQTFQTAGVQAGDHLYLTDEVGAVRVNPAGYELSRTYDAVRVYTTEAVSIAPVTANSTWYILRGTSGTSLRTLAGAITVAAAQTVTLPASTGTTDDIGRVLRIAAPPAGDENLSILVNNDYLILAVVADLYTLEKVQGATGWATGGTISVEIVDTVASSIAQVAVVNRAPFRRLLDAGASFVTNGVVAGDTLEIPSPAVVAGTDFTTVYAVPVESVDSEQRVTTPLGTDFPTVDPLAAQITVGYRIRRTLSKSGQRDVLLSAVEGVGSYQEKRLTLCFPDEYLLEDVTNAKTGLRTRQPGYYAAACVAGMCAGELPHQGLTRQTLLGVSEIFHSSRYFDEDDLEALSNAGFLLVVQDTPSSKPYILHQLTTDSSTIISNELSLVRTLDYVSIVLRDILDAFIGAYNINATTLEILEENVKSALDSIQADRSPRIGAPINGYEITDIKVLEGTSDRVEMYVLLDLPKPLNRQGLHLVSS